MPSSFGVIYLFCSSHDCLSEPTPQTVFKPSLVHRAGGASNLHYTLLGKHYKYLVPLCHLLLHRHSSFSASLLLFPQEQIYSAASKISSELLSSDKSSSPSLDDGFLLRNPTGTTPHFFYHYYHSRSQNSSHHCFLSF